MQNDSPTKTTIGQNDFQWGLRTYVMGVVNMTPDSFSGDGLGTNVPQAIKQALKFQQYGADIIDVGGESTRPSTIYSDAVATSQENELSRVIPVVKHLAKELKIPISIDTSKSVVAREAIKAGASMINDVWGFKKDPNMASVAVKFGVPVILMHNQNHFEYLDLIQDIINSLAIMRDEALEMGIRSDKIILDPGMGFGKTYNQNLEILRRLDEFNVLDQPLLVGMSRKSTIGKILDLPPNDRIEGTAATVALAIAAGTDIVRVHDVKEMVRVSRMSDAIVRGWRPR